MGYLGQDTRSIWLGVLTCKVGLTKVEAHGREPCELQSKGLKGDSIREYIGFIKGVI